MKKYFYSLIAATAMLFATTSCSEDEIVSQEGNDVNVSFTVQTAGLESRAIAEGVYVGKGNMADKLIYAVYEDGKDAVLIQNAVDETEEGKFTVTIPLAKNIAYDIVFFAYNEAGNAFGIDGQNATTIDLKNLDLNAELLANQEAYDAFFKTVNDYTPKAGNTTVTLNRPFAQLNVGTTLQDLADAADLDVEVTNSQIVVKKAYNQFNAFTGVASGEADLTYTSTEILETIGEATPGTSVNGASFEFTNEKFTVKEKTDDFYYLALAYVLAGETSEQLYDVDVTLYRNTDEEVNTLSVPNLKLQRNYRTNIIGNLLTSQEKFEVVIDEAFAEEEYNYTAWAGGVKEVTPVDGVYSIALAEELAWVAQQVNTGNATVKNATIKLIGDIDLKNIPWTPIGLDSDTDNILKGIFDGQGHTISNLFIDQTANPDYSGAGLFGSVAGTLKNFTIENATVKNLIKSSNGNSSNGTAVVAGALYDESTFKGAIEYITVKNAVVEGNRYVGGIAGYVYGTISNCTVEGIKLTATPDNFTGSYDNGDKVGGIAGYSENTIDNCTVTDFSVVGYRDLGGIAGKADGTKVTNSIAKEGSVWADMVTYNCGKTAEEANVGEVVGRLDKTTLATSNSHENVTTDVITGTATEPAYDETTKTYTVDSADDWMWFSEKSNLETGTIIEIKNNINLVGQTFKSINVARSATLTVKGNGNTISNAKIGSGNNDNTTGQASFFYTYPTSELTINDLTFDNIDVKAEVNGTGYAAVVVGYCEGKAILTNVDVKNSSVYGEKSSGAIAGHVSKGTNISLDGCNVTNCTIEVKEDRAGGLIGRVQGSATITNCTVDDATAQTESAPYSKSLVAPDGYANKYIGQRHTDCTSLTIDGAEYFDYYSQTKLTEYLASDVTGEMKIFLGTDVKTEVQARSVQWGSSSTSSVTINGNGNELKLIKGDSDWNAINLGNSEGKLFLNDLTWSADDNGNGAWNNYTVAINCEVEMNNVKATRAITLHQKSTLKNVTINEPGGYYAIYAPAMGQTITIDGLTVTATNGGRGIKVIDEYTEESKKVTLNVSNAKFKTAKKAAILVTSIAGADINLSNVDITDVEADKVNAVWVDEARVSFADLVTVTGGTKKLEGITADTKLTANTEGVYEISSASDLAILNEMMVAQQTNILGKNAKIKLTEDVDFTGFVWTPVDSHADRAFTLSEIDGNNKTISNLTINGQAMFTRFAGSGDVTIKNLTFDNATVTSSKLNTSILTVQSYQNVTLDNVDVKNSSITGNYKVAPLIATVYDETANVKTLILKNCDVENTIVKGQLDYMICGMVAWVATSSNETISFENCTVNNVTLQIPTTPNYNSYAYIHSTSGDADGSVNEADGVTVTNCKVERY